MAELEGTVIRTREIPHKVVFLRVRTSRGSYVDVTIFNSGSGRLYTEAVSLQPGDVIEVSGRWRQREGKEEDFVVSGWKGQTFAHFAAAGRGSDRETSAKPAATVESTTHEAGVPQEIWDEVAAALADGL